MFNITSLYDLLKASSSQEDCIKYLELVLWQNVPVSPFDKDSRVWRCKGGKYRCSSTGKYFNVMTGTMFENTKIELGKWFLAIWLLMSEKKGLTSVRLSRHISVSQKSAWFMLQKIRANCGIENNNELKGYVEMDESLIGGIDENRHVRNRSKNTGALNYGKTWVFGMLERGGKINAWAIKDREEGSILPFVNRFVKTGSRVITDMHKSYKRLSKKYAHSPINHDAYEFVNFENKLIHNNSIESAWRVMKDSLHRMYNHVSDKHLQIYLDEFVYRFNMRHFEDSDKFNWLLANCYVRVKYRDLIA